MLRLPSAMKSCPLSTSCPRSFYFVDEKIGWRGQFRGRFSEQYYKEQLTSGLFLFEYIKLFDK